MTDASGAARRRLLVLNAGSSSLKFSLLGERGEELAPDLEGVFERLSGGGEPHFVARRPDGTVLEERRWAPNAHVGQARALETLLAFVRGTLGDAELSGVGHRVVHGGTVFTGPVQVDDEVLARLQTFVPLAPLHQPDNLRPIRLLRELEPALPQVACFDTAFHRTLPPVAERFALPEELHAAGLRRYGFHGLSYEQVARVLPSLDAAAAAGRTVAMHLGSGASMCALRASRSVATSMGFSVLVGLCMGTRCGALDPGVVLWLASERGMDARAIEALLYDASGLLGLSGLSSDMRTLLASTDARAGLAVDFFVYRIARELGSMAAALGGLDALVFTGGIGEHAAGIRERVCRDAAWLGVELDPSANAAGGPRITTRRSRVSAWVVHADEELTIARHTRRVLDEAAREEPHVTPKTPAAQGIAELSAFGTARSTVKGSPLAPEEVRQLDAFWRACNYLAAGMIYLRDNPLLREPLRPEHVKSRLLGHWGASPALSFVYAHLNRIIRARDLDAIFLAGPRCARRDGAGLPGGHLLRGLSGPEPRRGGAPPALQGVLLSGRRREPLHPGAAGLHPRGRGARLRALPRLWRSLRQPGAHRRRGGGRRRGRDRPARHLLAREQVPEPDPRRRRPAGAVAERLQDQQPHPARPHPPRRAHEPLARLRLDAVPGGGLRPGLDAPGHGGDARSLRRGDPGGAGRGAPG